MDIRSLTPEQCRLFRALIARLVTSAGVPRYTPSFSRIVIARSFEIARKADTPEQLSAAREWYCQQHHIRAGQSYQLTAPDEQGRTSYRRM